MSYLDYEENRIFYEETGEGKPLILLHGNTVSSRSFDPIFPFFSKTHHVVTLGFLGCEHPALMSNMEEFATMYKAFFG